MLINVPHFRVTVMHEGLPIPVALTAGAARAMIEELRAGVEQLQTIYGDAWPKS